MEAINRITADNLRASIEDNILYLGFNAVHRKPLAPSEVALIAEVIELCDSAELGEAVRLARKLSTPGQILAALERKKNPPPREKRRPRRGEIIGSRYCPRTGYIFLEHAS